MSNAQDVAGKVSQVDETIMGFLPEVSLLLGFIPGAQVAEPFIPLVSGLLKAVDDAAKAVSASKPGDSPETILQEVLNHLTPGKPNSPILSAQ